MAMVDTTCANQIKKPVEGFSKKYGSKRDFNFQVKRESLEKKECVRFLAALL